MKNAVKRLHLSLALIAGLFIICASISGVLLVFAKDIQRLLQPAHWQVMPQDTRPELHTLLPALIEQADRQGTAIEQLQLSDQPDHPWIVTLQNGEQWNLNPYSGEIIHRYYKQQDFYHWLMRGHRWLWIDQPALNPWARHLTSLAALLLMIVIILGYVMWATPRRAMFKRLTLRPRGKWRARIYHYHLLAGVCLGLPLILIAFTGLSFNWPTGKVFEAVTLSEMQPRATHRAVSTGGLQQLDLALEKGIKALPEASLKRIYFPQKTEDALMLRLQSPGQKAPFSYVWLDGGSAEVLGVHDAARAPAANRLWDFKYAFHTGAFYGATSQWLWMVITLFSGLLTASGYYMYGMKFARRKSARNSSGQFVKRARQAASIP